ncbi:GNAT family N-acetyltransferase [Fimbriimonas ginsengisoli]|uniref:GNAT family N-acetyltransferase n=1 Tax=Fimbriimonas ginsengisoli TaxID=1005039 RepID=UPI000A0352DA|nr:GNAT family N-acetyltransferase [Fimbriimonas ginsengisoli]
MSREPILIDLPSELRGPRVLVRPYRPGDGAALQEAVSLSREHLKPWMPWADAHTTVDESEALVRRFDARWRLREDLGVGIWDIETGRYLGGSGLHRIDWDVRRFEIGYWIRADAAGKGYVTEAAGLLCQLAFGPLEANRVLIRCATENRRSAAIPIRLGFLYEGTHRNEGRRTDGLLFDMEVYGMTADRWRQLATAEGMAPGESQSGQAPAASNSPDSP